MEKKERGIIETEFEDREITSVDSDGKFGVEKIKVKEYRVPVKDLEGTVSIMLKRKDKYTGVRIDEKDVMVYVGENKNGNRWLTEINNQVRSHQSREAAEDFIGKKLGEMVRYLGEKANHIYRMAKTNTYSQGKAVRHEYGDLVITKIEKVEDVWNVHVLERPVWVYGSLAEALKEAKKYFIRFYIQREFIESPWGNYMGGYREIIEQYTQKIIDKEKFVDEKRSLWNLKSSDGIKKASIDEFYKNADSHFMAVVAEACMCIGHHYLSELFEKDYPKPKAVSMLTGVRDALENEEDRESMDNLIKNFAQIKNMVLRSEERREE